MEKLKVIIVGAGMGGLTTALAMLQAGYDVEICDRVSALRPAGAGISLWSNGVKVLNRLGLGAQIARIGGPMKRMAYYAKTGELLTDFSLQPLIERVGQAPYPVARTDLQQMLLEAVDPQRVQLNKNCVAIEQTEDEVTAIFADGYRATGDVVVGADGTHSVVRSYVLGEVRSRRYAGYVNWNGLVEASEDLAPRQSWVTYVGDGQRASVMPVGGNRFYFFFDVPSPTGGSPDPDQIKPDLREHFAGWAEPVQHLIERLDPDQTNRVEIHDIEPLETLVKGRVALLGDAAHSTAPDLGQGGCQAMEDAWALANALVTTNLSVADALQRYQAQRKERVANIILGARKRAAVTHGQDKEKTQQWYAELAQEDGSRILSAIEETILAGPLK